MKKIFYLLSAALFFVSTTQKASAQQYWSANDQSKGLINTTKAVSRLSFPKEFKLFTLNIEPLRQELFTVTDNRLRHSTIISLPDAEGNIEQFEVFEASNFEPDLQAQFPEIRAFSGKGITDKYATLKLSISPQGIQTMIFRTEKENEFIEPYSQDHTVYAVFKSHRNPGQLPWTCSTVDKDMHDDINAGINKPGSTLSSAGELKTLRLAQSCNGEYANYFGATSAAQVSLVLAAFNATLTRCNGCYEKDLALHLNLIAATTNVIYYNPSTDPYSTNISNWNSQLQTTLTNNIGEANYDIGHMFGASGGGGNAGCIGCVCVNGSKGSGITSPADGIPEGDNFDIDYVVHEVGHQLGANHTFSHALEGTGVNKEVGSGITIMGYAGITNWDVAPHSIDIYHEASIAQIQSNLAGKTCPVTTNISANNATPVVAAVSNYTIPMQTAFALTGSATDANAGDVLTYCWEQNDNSTTSGNNSVASATKATGPNWISFSPSSSPTRLFPKLSTILAGLQVSPCLTGGDAVANTEALSSVARTLNFRLTVRDNCPYSSTTPVTVGQTSFTDMTVTVSAASGPFAVTAPNTAVTWAGSSTQTVTWSVNNTTAAPVSCANVKISLSVDGGQTFPYVLAASTPNDGTENITVPWVATTTARVKVEAVGNIFFDIGNSNFTITAVCPTITVSQQSKTDVSCNGLSNGAASINIPSGGVSPYTYNWTPGNPTGDGTTSISGLTAGTWICNVSDANGCPGSLSFTINQPAAVPAPTVTSPVNYCKDQAASALTATGSSLLWYTVSSGGSGTGTAPTPSTGTTGTTSYYVSQTVGSCEGTRAQIDVIVKPLPTITVSNITNNVCHGGSEGSVTVSAAVAPSPYTYTMLTGPVINTTGQSSGIFTGLPAGSYTFSVQSANSCSSSVVGATVTEPAGTLPNISLGADFDGNFFGSPGIEKLIVYNVSEVDGNAATGDTIRIISTPGYTITFDNTATSATIGATTYPLDNSRWKLDNSNPTFASLIMDPLQNNVAGTLGCSQRVYVSINLTRNTANASTFSMSSRLRKANNEVSLGNNLNTIVFTAE